MASRIHEKHTKGVVGTASPAGNHQKIKVTAEKIT